MKKCLKCGQTYTDDTLNFCLNDGEMLVQHAGGWEPPPTQYADDSPPTVLLEQPRQTNPIDWASSGPPQWQGQQPSPMATTPQYGVTGYTATRDQLFPTISLSLGIASLVLICGCAGFYLGLPAAVFGFIALRNIEARPDKYTGRGMAIGGMVIGIITFLATLFFLIFGQLS